MSTKIYNGYYLKSMSFQQLQKFCLKFKQKLMPVAKKAYNVELATLVAHYFDARKFHYLTDEEKQELKGNTALDVARSVIRKAAKEIAVTNKRNPQYDFKCDVTFIPTKYKILALLYAEKEEFIDVWKGMNGVKEYGYWDNSDCPEEFPLKLWKKRGKEWDKALGKEYIPANVGFSYNPLADDYNIRTSSVEEVLKHLPKPSSRTSIVANEILMKEFKSKHETVGFPLFFEYLEWVKGEGNDIFVNKEQEVAKSLSIISKADLLDAF